MDIKQYQDNMKQALEFFKDEAKKVRTGRAHAGMLDGVTVMAYGSPMPLNQVANVTAPEAQLLQVTPFDPGNLQAIASAIRDNPSLGLNPSDDGRVVRVPVPPLNEERRREFTKVLSGKVEETMVRLRNVRHDALGAIATAKKEKHIGEDDAKRLEKQIDDSLNGVRTEIEAVAKAKETEIMTI